MVDQCTSSVPIVKNSQKTVKQQKMTIGVPIVTSHVYTESAEYTKSHMGFSKNPLLDPYNLRWLKYAILKIDMTSFFSAEGGPIWI